MAKKIVRNPIIRVHLADECVVDSFAGGGGASSGIEWALGRSPDIAINHDAEAIAMHKANHPTTRHYTESVWQIDPVEACGGKPVALAWFSPDCCHFSKAKGGTPRSQKIRGLAWSAVRWATLVRPRVIALENVIEFKDWGPLNADGIADKARKGKTFRAFVRKLEKAGYVVEHRVLKASDFGAPTSRTRFFLIARCDGQPITWPEPTHGPGRSKPFRTAAECIDWSIPCPSIFGRTKSLAAKTEARIARGIRKFVLQAARPFIAPVNHGGTGRDDHRVHSIDEPMRTITTHGRGSHALVVPYLVHRSNGERPATATAAGQAPRIYDLEAPLGTIMAQGQKHALVSALLVKHNGGNNDDHGSSGQSLDGPVHTITARDTKSLTVAHLIKMRGTSEAHLNSSASSLDEPMPTVTASGTHMAAVFAFLVRYNGKGEPEELTKPLGTLTTKDRYGLVTVTIDGEEYIVADIGMRMLSARELFTAQGFGADYDITAESSRGGKALTKTAQVRMCGNSVCPPLGAAIVRAQFQAQLASSDYTTASVSTRRAA